MTTIINFAVMKAVVRSATRRGECLHASPATIRRAARVGLARLGAGASPSSAQFAAERAVLDAWTRAGFTDGPSAA